MKYTKPKEEKHPLDRAEQNLKKDKEKLDKIIENRKIKKDGNSG